MHDCETVIALYIYIYLLWNRTLGTTIARNCRFIFSYLAVWLRFNKHRNECYCQCIQV